MTHRFAALNGAALPCVSKFTLDHMIAPRYRQDITIENMENLKWQAKHITLLET